MSNEHQIQTYRPKQPDSVQAVKFMGWSNASEIHKWADNTFFVPRGYDHALRQGHPREYDRSNGHLLDDAPEFLVLRSGYSSDERVDVWDWIVRLDGDDGNGDTSVEFHALSEEQFQEQYGTLAADSPEAKALNTLFALTAESHVPEDFYDEYNVLAEALGLEKKK